MRKSEISKIQKVFGVESASMAIIRKLLDKKLDPIAYEESFYGEKYNPDGHCKCSDPDSESDYTGDYDDYDFDDPGADDCCIYASLFPFEGSWAEQVLYHLNLLTDCCLISEMQTKSGLTVQYLDRGGYTLPTLAAINGEIKWVADLFEIELL